VPEGESARQIVVGLTLLAALVGFAWGRWRYDIVALAALAFLAALDIVPRAEAFSGFGHPAVITVAAVLVLTRGLENSGLVDLVARHLVRASGRPEGLVASHAGVAAATSGFMNNVGALALLMPVAIRVAKRAGHSRAIVLMPLAFASLLGGLVTLIGTPPNIIVASAREPSFAMFDFAPVGGAVAVAGVIYLALIGWRLIPRREDPGDEGFSISGYLTELIVKDDAAVAGKRIAEVEEAAGGSMSVLALVRGGRRQPVPSGLEVLAPQDVLIVEAEAEALGTLLADTGLETVAEHEQDPDILADGVGLLEVVVQEGGLLAGRSAYSLRLRDRFRVNLIAIARQGGTIHRRLNNVQLRAGDVLLLQTPLESASSTFAILGCLPLAERGLRLGARPRVLVAVVIVGAALIAAAGLRLVPIELAIVLAALTMGLAGLVSLREAYEAIDWPVLILLGAMLPVGAALETTGAAARVAGWIASAAGDLPTVLVVALVLFAAMMLSDIVNNAAAAVLLIPVSLGLAETLAVAPDALLMAVAVGASCAFLTPIGHQSNILVMGPGGYQFRDYWRVGLPLEVVVMLVAAPLITRVWA
jgi:di/tricarboxylate transporter